MTGLPLALCAALLIGFSQTCMRAASDAARVFAEAVMPALFPMLVVASLGAEEGEASPRDGGRFQRAELLLFGWLAGSPAAARRVQRARACEGLPLATARRLCVATGTMSPMFFLGTLAAWLGSASVGLMMLVSHWLSALLTGFLASALERGEPGEATPKPAAPRPACGKRPSLLQTLPAALSAAARALMAVCGAMMLFSILAALIQTLLFRLFPAMPKAPLLFAVGGALLEIGGGAYAVARAGGASPALLCALCSFGGLSLWVQNMLFTNGIMRPGRLLLWRAAHGLTAYGVCRALMGLWPTQSAVMSGVPPALWTLPPLARLPLGFALALLTLWARRSRTCWRRS